MNKLFVILSILVCNYSHSQYKYILEGKLQYPTKEKKIYLEIRDHYSLNEYKKIDSCIIENGLFRFSGELNKKSETASLFFHNEEVFNADKFYFILDIGLNFIEIDPVTAPTTSSFSNTKRPVSISNEMFTKQDSLYKIYFEKYATDVKTYNVKKMDEIKMVKMLDNREMSAELREKQLEIVKDYPNSFYSLIFLYQSLHYDPYTKFPSVLLEIFKNLDGTVKNDFLGIEFNKVCKDILKAEEETRISRQVPVFKIKTDKGKTFTNASLLGKPYVIAFSATWCAPCKIMEPKLKLFYENYKNKGLEVIYFNFDGDDKKWKEHISKNHLNWTNVSDGLKPGSSPISKQFNIQMIPHYIVVDKKGTIIYNSDIPRDNNFLMLEKYIKKAID